MGCFPLKALAWRPFFAVYLTHTHPQARDSVAQLCRQAVEFQLDWDWMGIALDREMEDGIKASLPGRALLLHRAGHVSWFLGPWLAHL